MARSAATLIVGLIDRVEPIRWQTRRKGEPMSESDDRLKKKLVCRPRSCSNAASHRRVFDDNIALIREV